MDKKWLNNREYVVNVCLENAYLAMIFQRKTSLDGFLLKNKHTAV